MTSPAGEPDIRGAQIAADLSDPEVTAQTSLRRWPDLLVPANAVALAWTCFQIALLIWPHTDILIKRSGHVGFACALALILTFRRFMNWPIALLFTALALAPGVYLWSDLDRLYDRIPNLDVIRWTDYFFALLLVNLLLLASYRRLGIGLVAVTLFFIVYQLFGGLIPGFLGHRVSSFGFFIDILFLAEQGLFGVPTAISVNVIFYFILFAAIFDVYGGGRLIIDLALWLTGRSVGGPAKAAVVASAATGSISGSAIANVMSTGIFTIPLMKRVGYSPTFAAGTEAAASTGGQIMPPVMGAGAFIMAEFLQIPYATVALGALIPALLYMLGVLIAVHLQARRVGMKAVEVIDAADFGATVRRRWHLLLPILWLVIQIIRGYDIIGAVIQATMLTVVVGTILPGTRRSLIDLIEALIRTSERAIVVALPCALASIIVMTITLTGLGTKFSSLILLVADGNLWLAVALGGIGCLILGCGMPTSSAYIMAAILIAPAIVKLGIDPLVAHMYIFYIAVLAMVTPPVALAAYAAAGLASCSANAAGWQAFKLALPGLAVAWAMMLQPSIVLWVGLGELTFALFQVVTAISVIAALIIGWLGRPLSLTLRIVALLAMILMLAPSLPATIAGCALTAVFFLACYRDRIPYLKVATSRGRNVS